MEADENSLDPLDRIRTLEMAGRRRIAAARKDAETVIQDERQKAKASIDAARRAGQQEGQAQYEKLLADAGREAQALLEQSRQRADAILKLKTSPQTGNGECWLDRSLQTILDTVLERKRWGNHR
jgi:vacuolar-type H+-ATPase subunit H